MDIGKTRQDAFRIGGHAVLELFDADGKLKERRETNNLVVNDWLVSHRGSAR